MYRLIQGNSKEVLKTIADNSVDAIATDPPYEIGFMGKGWDSTGIAYDVELWSECLRILKPGGYMAAFGATKAYHRMACAIEDSGFTIRDTICWIYGSGFPKGLDLSKAIDKRNGHHRGRRGELLSGNDSMDGGNFARTDKGEPITDEAKEWAGWWTTLKPATEPIVLAQKPYKESITANVLTFGVGGLNIDACRHNDGKYPMNVILGEDALEHLGKVQQGFFYCPKTSKYERDYGLHAFTDGSRKCYNGAADGAIGGLKAAKNTHPTVKPVDLMRWLVRLVTPKGGLVVDPFCGSGSTGIACVMEGCDFIGVDLDKEYLQIAKHRINAWEGRAKIKP